MNNFGSIFQHCQGRAAVCYQLHSQTLHCHDNLVQMRELLPLVKPGITCDLQLDERAYLHNTRRGIATVHADTGMQSVKKQPGNSREFQELPLPPDCPPCPRRPALRAAPRHSAPHRSAAAFSRPLVAALHAKDEREIFGSSGICTLIRYCNKVRVHLPW